MQKFKEELWKGVNERGDELRVPLLTIGDALSTDSLKAWDSFAETIKSNFVDLCNGFVHRQTLANDYKRTLRSILREKDLETKCNELVRYLIKLFNIF